MFEHFQSLTCNASRKKLKVQGVDLLLAYSVVAVVWIKPPRKKMSCFDQKEFTIIVRYTKF